MRERRLGVRGHGPPIMRFRLDVTPEIVAHAAGIDHGLGEVGDERKRLAIGGECGFEPAELAEGIAQIVMEDRGARVDLDALAKGGDRPLGLAELDEARCRARTAPR